MDHQIHSVGGHQQISTPAGKSSSAPKPNYFTREIYIDQSIVGLIIGRGGSNLKNLQDQFKVFIDIDKSQTESSKRKIVISGKTEKSVQDAAEELDIQELRLPIEDVDYVCGINDKNLDYFHNKSDVLVLRIETGKSG